MRRSGAGALVAAVLGWGLLLSPSVRADDEAWKVRLGAELAKQEAAAAKLDGKKAEVGSLAERVKALQVRVVDLENSCSIVPGTVEGRADLGALTKDIVNLEKRIHWVAEDREAAEAAKKKSPGGKPEAKPKDKPKEKSKEEPAKDPAPPAEVTWPETLTFKATAKITYMETGEWFIDEMHRSGLGDDFLMDGYDGTISFSIRAQELVREIRGADLRVAVKIAYPFTAATDLYRVYEVRWNAKQTLWNGALKTWSNHDRISVSGPIGWIVRPKRVSEDWAADAYVLSVTTKDGKVVRFTAPEFTPR